MKTAIAWESSRLAPISRVHEVVGNILQDEKIPGVHMAFGDPYGRHTGRKMEFHNAYRRSGPGFRHLGRRPDRS